MFGRFLILVGVVFILMGIGLLAFEQIPGLGRLPGDLVIRRGNWTLYLPIATSILLSIILTVLLNFLLRR